MKTKVIVCTEYSEQARAELLTRFGDRFDITFDEHAAALGDAGVSMTENVRSPTVTSSPSCSRRKSCGGCR